MPGQPGSDPDTHPRRWTTSAKLACTILLLLNVMLIVAVAFGWRISPGPYLPETGGTVADWLSAIGTVAALFSGILVFSRQQRVANDALETSANQLTLAREDMAARGLQAKVAQAARVSAWVTSLEAGQLSYTESSLHDVINDARAEYERAKANYTTDLQAIGLRVIDAGPLTARELAALPRAEREEISASHREYTQIIKRFGNAAPSNSSHVLAIRFSNLSEGPIYNVKASLNLEPVEMGDRSTYAGYERAAEVLVLPPLAESTMLLAKRNPIFVPSGDLARSSFRNVKLELTFVDAAGTAWKRSSSGNLSAIDELLS